MDANEEKKAWLLEVAADLDARGDKHSGHTLRDYVDRVLTPHRTIALGPHTLREETNGDWSNVGLKYTAGGIPAMACARVADLEGQVALQNTRILELTNRVLKLEKECERERMRLVACGEAARGSFGGCNENFWSDTLTDVLDLHKKKESCEARNERLDRIMRDAAVTLHRALSGPLLAYGYQPVMPITLPHAVEAIVATAEEMRRQLEAAHLTGNTTTTEVSHG